MNPTRKRIHRATILGGSALASILAFSGAAMAQTAVPAVGPAPAPADASQPSQEIVVTGSRIRTTDTTTPAPVTIVNSAAISERGFTQAGQALNELPSITPSFPRNTGIGSPVANVQTSPNLFNMGAGRTLSLMNGRRLPTTAAGTMDPAVDANIIPTGLIERIDVVQAGGAAVYGSGAIAGVVNYVLKRNFDGLELDGQYSITSRGDYPIHSLRGTFGKNFDEGRGNFAINLEYSKSAPLKFSDRSVSNQMPYAGTNPANTSATDGIPATIYFNNTKTWSSSYNGMFWARGTTSDTVPSSLLRVNGTPVQFNDAGNALIPFNIGTVVYQNLAVGGDGVEYASKSSLFAGIQRISGTAIASYELTDDIRVSTELLYARTRSNDPLAQMRAVQFDNTSAPAGGAFSFAIYADNAYLTPEIRQQLQTAAAASGILITRADGSKTPINFVPGGDPLYLGKFADKIQPDTNLITTTTTYRAELGVDGDFSAGDRDFNWSVSGSWARVTADYKSWYVLRDQVRLAADAVYNAAGDIVCRVNQTTVTDPRCVPINLFGRDNISDAARSYVNTRSGRNQYSVNPNYTNDQTDLLASFGGDLIRLPAGKSKFNITYEHREESTKTIPLEADRLGLVADGIPLLPMRGKLHTNEIAGELLVPIIGGDISLPLVQALEFNGSFRFVDDSLVGKENVWGLGLRWDVMPGLTMRSSLSRNFRAPSLNQLKAPAVTAIAGTTNPCSVTQRSKGSNPAAREANCLALFEANPGFGVGQNSKDQYIPAGASAQTRLEYFLDNGDSFKRVAITTGGNPDLKNEVSKTLTFGLVFQPRFVPGLVFTADRIRMNLKDALSAFSAANFMATCFDSTSRVDLCDTFTYNPDGTLATATSTTYNAGSLKYRGDIFNLSYRFNIARMFGSAGELGNLTLSLQATHNRRYDVSVTGLDLTHRAGTTQLPSWVLRPEVRYNIGRLRVNYSAYYMPAEPMNYTDTVENASVLPVKGNTRHNISASYRFDKLELRAGINNFTDKMPSYPYGAGYGDIIGRQFFVGAKVNY